MLVEGSNSRGRKNIASAVLSCFLLAGMGAMLPVDTIHAKAKTSTSSKVAKGKQAKSLKASSPAKGYRAQAGRAAQRNKDVRVSASARSKAKAGAAAAALATVPASATYQSVLAGPTGVRLELPRLASQAVFVIDNSTGLPLLSKNGNDRRPIASITKLMTAMVVLDSGLDLKQKIRVTDADVDRVKFSSSKLAVGAELTREDMLHLALMASENRAAHALGRNYPGGEPAFVQAMNDKAKALGLRNTRFMDPTGLNPGNQASPRDLAHMVSAASAYHHIRQFSTAEEDVVNVNNRQPRLFRNTNALVRNDNWDITVSKTGYIQEAGRCLVMNAMVNNRATMIVLLNSGNSQSRIADSVAIKRWLEQQETQSTLRAAEVLMSHTTKHSPDHV